MSQKGKSQKAELSTVKILGSRPGGKMRENKAKFHFLQNRSGSRALPLKIIFNKYGNQPVLRKCWETWEEMCTC